MISHDRPRFTDIDFHPWRGGFGSASDIEPCAGCGNDTHLDERLSRNVETIYCSACRETCAICGEWIAGKSEMRDAKGNRIHVACEVLSVLEMMSLLFTKLV